MKRLEVRFSGNPSVSHLPVGTLIDQKGRIFFEYSEAWLQTGLNLSPFRLPFEGSLHEHQDRAFGPLPGVFDDSLPDGWGLLLMDRHFRQKGVEISSLSPLDRLAWIGSRGMGALTYHPPTSASEEDREPFNLGELARQSQELLTGSSRHVLPQLLRAGGSPGGARPKVLVGFNPRTDEIRSGEDLLPEGFDHWMVKFPAHGEPQETGSLEFAYSLMAKEAGLEMPETRLFETAGGARFFGIRRFDRASSHRTHAHTFGNLIQANFRIPSCDYLDLLKAAAALTRNHQEVLKAFGRSVFNVFAHNRDDHAKNFAFLMDDATGEWSLAPAYDLTFSSGPAGEHTMTVAGEGRAPDLSHLLRLAEARGVSRKEATEILERIKEAVARWPEFAKQAGLGGAKAREIGGLLDRR